MEDKYLPIGTICTIKGKNIKIMIIGYYAQEYNGNIKFMDYSGIAYPEGMLKMNSIISFNHADIENVLFKGYVDESFSKLSNNLNGKTTESKITSSNSYSKIEFDENGVVVVAEPIVNEPISNDEPKYLFDDQGFVIGVKKDNPFHQTYETDQVSKQKYEFDENGVVIAVNNEKNKDDKSKTSGKYQFDENGVVIGVNDNQTAPKKEPSKLSAIKFDENGIVVAG